MKLMPIYGDRVESGTGLRQIQELERANPDCRAIHAYLGNAFYCHTRMLSSLPVRPEFIFRLLILPPYTPRFNPIDQLSGAMHRHATCSRFYPKNRQFTEAKIASWHEPVHGKR